MLNSISYSFNNRFLSRFIIMHKLNLDQVNLMPTLNKIVLFFSLKDLETLDDVRIYNYFYFFKFFFGLRASFAGYKSFFNLGKTTFNVKIQLILTNNDIYSCLKFFSNDVFALLDLSYIFLKTSKIFDNVYVYNYVLKDMNMLLCMLVKSVAITYSLR